jgi:hypothetical protein
MELIVAIGMLVALAVAGARWGYDSRELDPQDGWFGARRPDGLRPGGPRRAGWSRASAPRLALPHMYGITLTGRYRFLRQIAQFSTAAKVVQAR